MTAERKSVLDIVILTGGEAFDEIQSEWNELHLASEATVFQSHAWLRTWWRHFGEDFPFRELHVVLVRQNGKLVGSAPFFIEAKRISTLASTKELRFIGEGLTDYNDLLLEPGSARASLEAVADHIASLWKKIDAIHLPEIPDGSPTAVRLPGNLRDAGVNVSTEQCDKCPRLELRDTWAATLAALHGDKKRQLQKKCRQLSESHTVVFETIADPSDLEQAMADFIGMHQRRMEESGKTGVFSNPRNEAFIRDLSADFLNRGWLFLSFLRINGRRVAATFSYLFKDRVLFHMAGLGDAGDARKHSPGIVLHAFCMQEAIRRCAVTYDFLRGTEEYKYRLGAADFPNWSISARRIRPHIRILGFVGSMLGRMRRVMVPCALRTNASRSCHMC